MHVLVVSSEPYLIPSVPLGGIFQYHQLQALKAAGIRTGVASGGVLPFRDIVHARPPLLEESDVGLCVRNFRQGYRPLRFVPSAVLHENQTCSLVDAVRLYVRHAGRPDVVHAHNLQYAGLAASRVKQEMSIPFVITEHSSAFLTSSYPQELKPKFSEALRSSHGNYAVSKVLAGTLGRLFDTDRLIRVLANVIDPAFGRSTATRNPTAEFVILSVGRLDENKNHALLIKAFAQAFPHGGAVLRIAGEGKRKNALRTLAASLGIQHRVAFLGVLDRSAVAREMRQADCLALSSIHETFGVVAIEALAMGTPVLTTPCGGPADFVNESNGLITRSHHVEDFAKALRQMHAGGQRFDRNLIRAQTLKEFGPEQLAERLLCIYKTATGSRQEVS